MTQLNNPEFGVRHERDSEDAYRRNYKVLMHYATANGFEDELTAIIDRHRTGPAELTGRRLKIAIDTAQIKLKDEIEAGREGTMPFVETFTYEYVDIDGRRAKFTLNPDEPGSDIKRQFERVLSQHPNGEEIGAQFETIFREIRKGMVEGDWVKEEASSWASILAIKQLCDTWLS